MSVKINIPVRNDVSFLFQGASGVNDMMNSDFFTRYASIKNGSYGKLLKAYYEENGSKLTGSPVKSDFLNEQEDTKKLTKLQVSADALKEAADDLRKSDYEDPKAVMKKVASFVKNYNDLLENGKQTADETVSRRLEALTNETKINTKALGTIGITADAEGKLTLNEETFEKSDMTKVQNLFKETGSYGYHVSSLSYMVRFASENAVKKGNTYGINGTLNAGYNNGYLFSSYF